MGELTLNQIERIDRLQLSRHRKRELTEVQKFDRNMARLFFIFALLILGIVFLIKAEWSPGNQAAIHAEYKATQHDAITVASKEAK